MTRGPGPDEVTARLDAVLRAESGRIRATLIAILRDFELAEAPDAQIALALHTLCGLSTPTSPAPAPA